MFKFKKIILFLVLISPLIVVLFVGYPLNSNPQTRKLAEYKINNLNYSKRCFRVGVLGEFVNCFNNNVTIKGRELINLVNNEAITLFPGFNIILFLALIVQIALVFLLI